MRLAPVLISHLLFYLGGAEAKGNTNNEKKEKKTNLSVSSEKNDQ